MGFVGRICLFQEALQSSIEILARRDSGGSKMFQISGDALRTVKEKNSRKNPAVPSNFDATALLIAFHRVVPF